MPEDQGQGQAPVQAAAAESQSNGQAVAAEQTQTQFVEVGGEKIPLDQAIELISKGRDYTKKTQTLAEERRAWEEERAQLQTQQSPEPQTPEEEELERTKAELRKYGVAFQDDVDRIITEKTQAQLAEERRIEAQNQQHSALEAKYNGQDGRPAYKRDEILAYIQEDNFKRGIFDPEIAWKVKHEKELIDWQIKQAMSPKGTYTESTRSQGPSIQQQQEKPAGSFSEAGQRFRDMFK